MKKILLSALVASSLLANEENFIEVGVGFIKSKDNFSTESNAKISSLKNADSENNGFAYIDFFYGYDLNEDLNIYLYSDIKELNLGSALTTEIGVFDFGLKMDVGEEWENPFLMNTNRQKTDTKEYGAYISYGLDLTENIKADFNYEFSRKSLDNDTVVNALKREGNRHILSMQNSFITDIFNKEVILLDNLSYEKYDADGKASSYDKYGLELGFLANINKNVSFTLLGSYAKKDYEAFNPEVNKNIDVDIYDIFTETRWEKPFGYEDVYVSLKAGYEKEEANVNFYNKENTFAITSIGYKF